MVGTFRRRVVEINYKHSMHAHVQWIADWERKKRAVRFLMIRHNSQCTIIKYVTVYLHWWCQNSTIILTLPNGQQHAFAATIGTDRYVIIQFGV